MLLSHSNVVQVFDAGESSGQSYMAMEWVDGLNLAQLTHLLREGGRKLSFSAAAFIVGEVLRALAYAHALTSEGLSHCIVHRDVSPQNILLSVSGEVKLADFGVARLAREETSGLHVKGKLRYMAPEQLAGHSRNPAVDIYAAGAVFHELLAGHKFRDSIDEAHMYGQVANGVIPTLSEDVPLVLNRLRLAMLAARPEERLVSAEAGLEVLMGWPSYRNASLELAQLVRDFMGVSAPRSGVFAESKGGTGGVPTLSMGPRKSGVDSERETLEMNGVERERGIGISELITTPMGRGPEATVLLVEEGAVPKPAVVDSPDSPERGQRRRIGLVSSLGLAFALLAAAVAVLYFGLAKEPQREGRYLQPESPIASSNSSSPAMDVPDPRDPRTLPSEASVQGSNTALARSEESQVREGKASLVADYAEPAREQAEPSEKSETATGSAPTGSGAKREGTGRGKRSSGKKRSGAPGKKKSATPVEVLFKVGDFTFVYVRVAGQVLALEPQRKISLEPGRYPVEMRGYAEDAPWRDAGTLRVEAGKSVVVRMVKPHRIRVSTQ